MSGWRNGDEERLATYSAEMTRGFPFSREAGRRLEQDHLAEAVELERRYEGLMGELDAIGERLDAIGQACYMLAIRYADHGDKEIVVEGLKGAVPELGDLANQVRAVRKAAEDA